MQAQSLCVSALDGDSAITLATFFNVYDCLNTSPRTQELLAALNFTQVLKVADW
jgi:hypothetical protein